MKARQLADFKNARDKAKAAFNEYLEGHFLKDSYDQRACAALDKQWLDLNYAVYLAEQHSPTGQQKLPSLKVLLQNTLYDFNKARQPYVSSVKKFLIASSNEFLFFIRCVKYKHEIK